MKKFMASFLMALVVAGPSFADTASDLVSLGMHPELAEYVAALSTKLSNAEWIQATDQAGTGTINMIKVDATDDLVVNADSGDLVKISVATTPVAAVGAATPVAAFTPGAVANWVINGSVLTTASNSSGAFTGAGLMIGTPIAGKTPAAGNASIGGTLDVAGASTLASASVTGGLSMGSVATDAVFASAKNVQLPIAIITPSTNMTPLAAANIAQPVTRLVAGSPTLAAVFLPAATPNKGKSYIVTNEGSNPVLIFPGAAEKINAGGANTPVSLATGKQAECIVIANDTSLCASRN